MAVSVVVDASVALKWYLDDEADRAPALAIFQAWEDGQLDLLAPSSSGTMRSRTGCVGRRCTVVGSSRPRKGASPELSP